MKKISKIFEAILQALIYFVIMVFIVGIYLFLVHCIGLLVGETISTILFAILTFIFVTWCIYQNNK